MIRLIVIFVLIFGLAAGVYLVQRQQTLKSKAIGSPPPKVDRGPLTKVTFIHYRRNAAKPAPGATTKPSSGSCYGYIANGAKWRSPKDYIINPTGSALDGTWIQQTISKAVSEWEKYGGPNIFGLGSVDPGFTPVGVNNDGKNALTFGPYSDSNAIAVTTVWGYFSGDPTTREITEWDMLLNNYYQFGDATVNESLMDLQNIATHELGHGAGMADLYSTGCSTESMFGYSAYGEIIKRDLANGDIQGIKKLY